MAEQNSPLPPSLAGAPPQQWIASPSPVYLTGEEFLRVSSLANVGGVTLTITGRILRPDNTISRINFTHAPNSTRTVATTIVPLSEGWLLGLTVRASAGSPTFGQVWANLELGISSGATFAVDQTLGYGFLTANTPLAWPVSVNMLPLDGPANIRSIVGTQPAAGAEINEPVPTGARWELLAILFSLTTSAAAANRQTHITLDDGTNVFYQTPFPQNVVAGSGTNYQGLQGIWNLVPNDGGVNQMPLPVGHRLSAGFRIRTATPGIQAGDQYGSPKYLVREWMTGE